MTTKYRRKKMEEGSEMIHMVKVGMAGLTVLSVIAGTVWGASEYVQTFATKNEMVAVATQAQTALDLQMEDIMARIANLKAKPKKDQEDYNQIKYLQEQLDRVRRMRSIK
jgi:hypothetical protein